MFLNLIMYINVIHPKKIQQRIPPTTLVLKYICDFLYYVTCIILLHIYSICLRSSSFVIFLREFITLNLKLVKYT